MRKASTSKKRNTASSSSKREDFPMYRPAKSKPQGVEKEKKSRRSWSGNGEELVNLRIQVWWPKDKGFYPGTVKAFDPQTEKHTILYDDDEIEILNLRKETWRMLSDKVPPQNLEAGNSSPPREPTKIKEKSAKRKASMSMKQSTASSSKRYADDDMDAELHARKKHEGPSSNLTTSCTSPVMSKDLKPPKLEAEFSPTDFKQSSTITDNDPSNVNGTPKLEADVSPTDHKQSSIISDDGLLNINGFKVNASAAPVLEAIFEKHGDIAASCIFQTPSVRASLLEVVCNVVQKLQHHDLEPILADLENITKEVSDLAATKINVSWLNEHLAQLHKIVPFKQKTIELRKTKGRIGMVSEAASDELKERHAELILAKERFKEAEKRVKAVDLVSRKIEDDILEAELEEYFWRRRLDDLL